jgi:DNA polymerase-3 subunit epsilon
MAWHQELLIGFDLETTGTDPREARIVTAAVIEVRDGQVLGHREWLADPGVEIPADAVAVHGISNERAAAEGAPADRVADAIANVLTAYWRTGVPVVAYNAAFDLTLLSAELRRHGLPTVPDRLCCDTRPVIDPLVLDRAEDQERRGKRKLVDLCGYYEVVESGALHTADVDVVATREVLEPNLGRIPHRPSLHLDTQHEYQSTAHQAWAEGLNAWRLEQGLDGPQVSDVWPARKPVGTLW